MTFMIFQLLTLQKNIRCFVAILFHTLNSTGTDCLGRYSELRNPFLDFYFSLFFHQVCSLIEVVSLPNVKYIHKINKQSREPMVY